MTDEELDKEIERVKQKLCDYERLKNVIKSSDEDYQRQIDIMLDTLSKLIDLKSNR